MTLFGKALDFFRRKFFDFRLDFFNSSHGSRIFQSPGRLKPHRRDAPSLSPACGWDKNIAWRVLFRLGEIGI
jgi:hypothetical protein